MLLTILYIIGITAEAMTGAISAGKRKMDWFGVMFVASATAIGGGTARDIILGHYPVAWVKHPEYIIITCIAGVFTTLIAPWVERNQRLFVMLDSVGLVVFSIIGCQIAIDMGLYPIICVIAAIITGVFGGLLRDLICSQKPMVLHKELYAFVALFSGVLYLGLLHYNVHENIATLITLILGFSLRTTAVYFSWHLPVFHFESAMPEKNEK
ncbi:inner membrane protein YicG [Psychromonas sp. CNPT3]|uniref:trimeric intracellular cation channel family protein n=1 Tax=Psychromonas sp. CNPT3 TaxID=314282 RepID=UPI00006E56A6|nr:trimeric intracellular cation channel family protein [Psychromonas sp. CNPT3]AGH81543.1 inner membrane protein YicG [Psychromonas sp. CNPT3]